MKTTKIISDNVLMRVYGNGAICDRPAPGAKAVLWLIDGEWVRVGWLMPPLND